MQIFFSIHTTDGGNKPTRETMFEMYKANWDSKTLQSKQIMTSATDNNWRKFNAIWKINLQHRLLVVQIHLYAQIQTV